MLGWVGGRAGVVPVEEGIIGSIGSITNTGKYTQENTLVKHRWLIQLKVKPSTGD